MKVGYLHAVQECLPTTIVTIDKFHVVASANKVLDEIRSIIIGKTHHVRKLLFRAQERLTSFEQERLHALFEKS